MNELFYFAAGLGSGVIGACLIYAVTRPSPELPQTEHTETMKPSQVADFVVRMLDDGFPVKITKEEPLDGGMVRITYTC